MKSGSLNRETLPCFVNFRRYVFARPICLFVFFIADGELKAFRESLAVKAGKFVWKFIRLVIPEECKGTSAMIIL